MKVAKVNEMICRDFFQLGLTPELLGFKYLREAVLMVLDEPKTLHNGITKIIYPEIAKRNNTTASRVERAMRYAIECTFLKKDAKVLEDYFGGTFDAEKGKLTNGAFIAVVAEHIRIQIQKGGK